MVLELVPAPLAKLITGRIGIPTIGIGAGPDCDGQVLVFHDMVGLFSGFTPTFVKRYAEFEAKLIKVIGCLKKRLSAFQPELRQIRVSDKGIQLSAKLDKLRGILTGVPTLAERA